MFATIVPDFKLFEECRICPNECMAKRSEGETGECHSADEVIISSVGPHFGYRLRLDRDKFI